MILRKPYAFLIKHFKLIHLILAVLTYYSIYSTKHVLDFFNEYISNPINIAGQELVGDYITTFYKIVPIFIICVTIILLAVMAVKKKPSLFYIVNIIIYIFVFVVIFATSSLFDSMFYNFIDIRRVRLVRDLITMSFAAQFISALVVSIRAIGFDVKKFNFSEDLKTLEINDKDREEFEVQIKFNKNQFIRKLRQKKRYFIYNYKENKLLFNVFTVVIIGIVSYFVYSTFFYKGNIISENEYFSGNGFSLKVVDSYLIETDYKGKEISDENCYLVLKLRIKSTGKNKVLDIATTKILISNYYYIPTYKYPEKFIDFGDIYYSEQLTDEYTNENLVYEIPKKLIGNDFVFSYVDKINNENVKININYNDLRKQNDKLNIVNLGENLILNESILSDYSLKINTFDIKDKYKLSYQFCNQECFTSYEYLLPKLNTNYDKALLKIDGNLIKGENIDGVYDLYDFIEKFGQLYYINENGENSYVFNNNKVVSNRIKTNDYYVEVPKDVMNADSIYFIFTIRNQNYKYILK